MGTPSVIYLKLKDEDKGKTIKFHITKLAGSYAKNKRNITCNIEDVTIPKNARYMCITHQFDSHINSLGECLLGLYNTYDKILNLMVMGCLRTAIPSKFDSEGGVKSYQGLGIPDYAAKFFDDKSTIRRGKRDRRGRLYYVDELFLTNGELMVDAALTETYAYYFDGEEWYVAHTSWDYAKNEYIRTNNWLKLTEVMEKVKAGELQDW